MRLNRQYMKLNAKIELQYFMSTIKPHAGGDRTDYFAMTGMMLANGIDIEMLKFSEREKLMYYVKCLEQQEQFTIIDKTGWRVRERYWGRKKLLKWENIINSARSKTYVDRCENVIPILFRDSSICS